MWIEHLQLNLIINTFINLTFSSIVKLCVFKYKLPPFTKDPSPQIQWASPSIVNRL